MLPCLTCCRSSRCRTSCSSPTSFCRCTSSSRATARWSPTRWRAIGMIGMVLLRPGWERDYEGRPPVYPIGCSGVHHARRAAGRRPLQHRAARPRALPDRRGRSRAAATAAALVEPLRDAPLDADDRAPSAASAPKLEALLAPSRSSGPAPIRRMPAAMPDEDLVNALAQYLDLEPLEKQALLEQHVPAHARRVAGRAARDEDHDGAHARRVQRRALSAYFLSASARNCFASVEDGRRSTAVFR